MWNPDRFVTVRQARGDRHAAAVHNRNALWRLTPIAHGRAPVRHWSHNARGWAT